MRFHEEARRDAYDAVVVGSGIGGLTAAALLARAGLGVLVVERHDRPGGYAHAFRRRRWRFDSAVHLVGGCGPGGLVARVLDAVAAGGRCAFVPVDPLYAAAYPGLSLRAPAGPEEFLRAHLELFPEERKGLHQLLQDCLSVREEVSRADALPSPLDVARAPDRFPTLVRYRRATLRDALDAELESPRLQALLASLWPYLGLPPSRLSYLYFASMLASYVADGAWYCRGTFQRLAETLADAVRAHGGEVLLRSTVRRIRVQDGRARGVVLENGQRIEAPLVVSNADARQTVEELVGSEAFPRVYRRRLARMTPSISGLVVYLATDVDLARRNLAHETFFYTEWDHEAAYANALRGEPSWLSVTVPTLADPGLAPRGQHVVALTSLVGAHAVASWRDAKPRFAERLLELAESCVPGLRERLEHVEAATPRTLERYTRGTDGALYGWELTPAQVGPGRLANETPVAGLLLAGHWTRPGGGVYGVVQSGVRAAQRALGLPDEPALWRRLERSGRA